MAFVPGAAGPRGRVGTALARNGSVPTQTPQAAPPDSAGGQGTFTQPGDDFMVGDDQAGTPTHHDPAPIPDERPSASLWIGVVAVVLALCAGLYVYFLAIGGQ